MQKNPLFLSVEEQNQPPAEQYSQPIRSYRRHRSESKIKFLQILLVSLMFFFSLVVLFMGLHTFRLSAKSERISAELHKRTRQLVEVEVSLKRLRSERDSLIQGGGLPDLLPLKYDQIFSFAREYLRSITFTLTKSWGQSVTEYHVVLQNNTQTTIEPEVRVIFFGSRGIQIGEAKAIYGLTTYGKVVAPGEIRSYSGSIKLLPQENPYYFLAIAG